MTITANNLVFPMTMQHVKESTFPSPTTGKNFKAESFNIVRYIDGYAVHAWLPTSNTNPQVTKIMDKMDAKIIKNKLEGVV